MRRLLRLDAGAAIGAHSVGARSSAPAIASQHADDPHAGTKASAHAFSATAYAIDPFAAACVVRVDSASIEVLGSSAGVRALVQRLVGGPDELAAPRPLGVVEQSLWSLVVATALEDLGISGQVWPVVGRATTQPLGGEPMRISIDVRLGDLALAVEIRAPRELLLRVPARRSAVPGWIDLVAFEVPIAVGRCALHRDDLERLAVRSLVTLERPLGGATAELEIFGGVVGLRTSRAAPALAAEVATGYVPRVMALPDDAHVELTVALGTTQLSLRQLGELAVGQIVQLGRPLAGPFELRAAGRIVGRGELVDVDGELAVRIVSLGD